jgi:ATPase complex subunit ATP10
VREPLGMTSSRIGYVYLVDENLKIRWAACADAKEEEEEALIRCVGVLVRRERRVRHSRDKNPLASETAT